MYEYKAIVTNVVDGDTFDLDIDLGFHIHIHERVRLLDIDTPEKFGEEKKLGLIVKDYAEYKFLGQEVVIKSEEENLDTDSFGRWLVYMSVNGEDVRDIYDYHGINKKSSRYSEINVLELEELLEHWN